MAGVPAESRCTLLARSELSVPGSNWSMIEKAVDSDADIVFIDLEDAVPPHLKAASRDTVVRAIRDLDWGTKPRAYRINGLDTPFFYRDIIEVVEAVGDRIEVIVVPKVRCPADLSSVDTLLRAIEATIGITQGAITLKAQIETADGMVNAERIALVTPRLVGLIFGPGDYAASTRMPSESIGSMGWWDLQYPGHRFHYAMSRIVVAARAAGIQAIDGPVANFRDLDAFRQACVIARALGFDGKWCIHPGQIPVANEVFSPTQQEVEWAQGVVAAYREAAAGGKGAIDLGNTMVDEASTRMAETTLDLARRAGMISNSIEAPR